MSEIDRKFLQSKAESEFNNILENWCLLKYISLTGNKKELQSHWQKELFAAFRNISKYKLTNGNNRDIVYKAIYQIYIEMAEYNTLDLSYDIVYKFKIEKIEDIDLKELTTLFQKDLLTIIDLLAYKNEQDLIDYIQKI